MPVCIALYYLMPGRAAKNIFLFLASLVFYAWGEPVYVVLMIVSVFANYMFATLLGREADHTSDRAVHNPTKKARLYLILDLVFNLGVLGFFKYEGFLAQNLNALLGTELIPDLALPLPVGISFYTLQAVSYVIDVYRGEVEAQRNPLFLGMYIACFPQLVAGPIVRYSTIQEQIVNRKETMAGFCDGLRLFSVGLAKKVLLANVVAILATELLSMQGSELGLIGVWGGLLAYTFQIYFDFAGYSDMAIGLGRMFGFTYLRNFNYPYISRSATEFWRRWHISLGSFFRDYVYIPLGGNRVSTPRWLLNIAIVWLLTGIWHGAAWTFVLWGAYYGLLLIAEKTLLLKLLKRLPAFVQHIYALLTIMVGWLIFASIDIGQLGTLFAALVGAYGLTGTSSFAALGVWQYLPVFALCACASMPVIPWIRFKLVAWAEHREVKSGDFIEHDLPAPKMLSTERLCIFDMSKVSDVKRRRVLEVVALLADICLIVLFMCATISVISGSFNPFIYFRF